MGKENQADRANALLKGEFGSDITLTILFFLADLGETDISGTFIWQDAVSESEHYYSNIQECYDSARAYLTAKCHNTAMYLGSFDKVKQLIYNDYINDNVELCSFFNCTAPTLTISEIVKLYALLRYEIDGDRTIHFSEDIVIDLKDDMMLPDTDASLLRSNKPSIPI